MKYTLIKETDKIRLITGMKYIIIPGRGANPDKTDMDDIVSTRIYTDGEILSLSKGKTTIFPRKILGIKTDVNEFRDLQLKNYNYAIKVMTVGEYLDLNYYEIVKNVEVYLTNKKNKAVLRNVKKTLKSINEATTSPICFRPKFCEQSISYDRIEKDIYQLVKTK